MKPDKRASGFVLAATLWILAAITVGVGAFASWTTLSLQRANVVKEQLQGEIDQMSTEAVVKYFVAAKSVDLAGFIGEGEGNSTVHLRMDDRPYVGIGKGRFALQDEGGLLKLSDLPRFPQILQYMGVPDSKVGPLIDQFQDYVDTDNDKRLNGAEASSYDARGLPDPPNRALFTSWEAFNILDWASTESLWKGHSFPRMTTTIDIGGLPNLNSAPGPIIRLITGISEDEMKLVLHERESRAFSDINEIYAIIGRQLNVMEMEISFWASSYYRLSVWYEGSNRMREIHFKLALKDTKSEVPWNVSYMISTPLAEDQRDAQFTTIEDNIFQKEYF